MFIVYMAMDPFTNSSISTIVDGIAYYILTPGVRLFKVTKNSDKLELRPGQLSFFGVYNTDPAYVESYEEEYGIIFAFETTRPYKLLALDHSETKKILYTIVPENIQNILRKNYGYNTRSGQRNSELTGDLELSQYLCDQGYEGYATNTMPTDMGGTFHPEFMICDVGGIKSLRRITNDPSRIRIIVERGKADKIRADLEASRQEKRKNRQRPESPSAARVQPMSFAPTNLFASYDSPTGSPSSSGITKFSLRDMADEDDENLPPSNKAGGLRQRKRRSYKKRKTRTNKRKRRRTRRKKGTRRRR